jgi:hypothetical protein
MGNACKYHFSAFSSVVLPDIVCAEVHAIEIDPNLEAEAKIEIGPRNMGFRRVKASLYNFIFDIKSIKIVTDF